MRSRQSSRKATCSNPPTRRSPARSYDLDSRWCVDSGGNPFLEPSFLLEAAPALPRSHGDYEIQGHSHDGEELFSLSFTMPEAAHGVAGGSFAFALPIRPEWLDELERITLAGPGGRAVLDRQTDRPMAILRDASGQVRGILRDLSADMAGALSGASAEALLAESGIEALLSRGIPVR